MSSSAELHALYRISNEPVREFPYPHVYVRDVFPADFYRRMRELLPPAEALSTLSSMGRMKVGDMAAEQRTVLPLTGQGLAALDEPRRAFWQELSGWLLGGSFGQVMATKFSPWLRRRFPDLAAARFPASEAEARANAIKNRDGLTVEMTRAQIAEAQRLAREWKPQ